MFSTILCKWQTMILFPLVNQVFNPEFTTQPFIYDSFLLISVRFLLSCSLNRKLMVSSGFGSEIVLSDCDLFLVGFRDLDAHMLSHSCCYPVVFLFFLLGNPSKSPFFSCQHTVRLYVAVNSWITKKN